MAPNKHEFVTAHINCDRVILRNPTSHTVIQGSSIGPVMFLMYIDGLAKLLEHHGIIAKLFADDVKIYLIIKNDLDVSKNCKLPSI